MDEVGAEVIPISADKPDPANDGKLVYMTGWARAEGPLTDPMFKITCRALRLYRIVETYQWKEVETHEVRAPYSYIKIWADDVIDSTKFHRRKGRGNPDGSAWTYFSKTIRSRIHVGAFELNISLWNKIEMHESRPLTEEDLQRLPDEMASQLKLHKGMFYLSDNPSDPAIGDQRIYFRFKPETEVSLIARQRRNGFVIGADGVHWLHVGRFSMTEMLERKAKKESIKSWTARLLFASLILLGLLQIYRLPVACLGRQKVLGALSGKPLILFNLALTGAFALPSAAMPWLDEAPGFARLTIATGAVLLLLTLVLRVRYRASAAPMDGEF